jgi:DNA-directed RNA polymerase II subunit RPB2
MANELQGNDLRPELQMDELHFKIIDKYFKENSLVEHQISSCNNFYDNSIKKILNDLNPLTYYSEYNDAKKLNKYNVEMYIGGKEGQYIYYGKPVIYDEGNVHYMFPNEARLRNMNYGISIHYDIEVEYTIYDSEFKKKSTFTKYIPDNPQREAQDKRKSKAQAENAKNADQSEESDQTDHLFLGMFPIMVQSNLCILNNLPKETRYTMGECRHDYGGYFIVDGKEKVIIPQEKFGDNLIYIREVNDNTHDYSVEVRSVSEDTSKPQRTFAIRRIAPSPSFTNGQIVVFIPNVRKPIPLFIVFRALGIISDKDICKMIVHDLNKYSHYLSYLVPCVHDAGQIFNQKNALEFIGSFTKVKTINESYNILINYLLPHVGEMNFRTKALYIGHMVFELLKVINKDQPVTDRDSFKYKRVDNTGYLMKELFLEYANIMYAEVYKKIDKELFYNKSTYIDVEDPVDNKYLFIHLFNAKHFIEERYIEDGFKKAFKGNWGAKSHTKRVGVLQSINRLSYNSFMSHLRKINLDIDSSAKIVKPHMLHGSQWGVIDPVDTPDGGSVGFHKHMAIMCKITQHISVHEVIIWFMTNVKPDNIKIHFLEECDHNDIANYTKIFINGIWLGMIKDPYELKRSFREARLIGLIPSEISFSFDILSNRIEIYSDEGRLTRPLLYFQGQKISYADIDFIPLKWTQLIKGTLIKGDIFHPLDELKEQNAGNLSANKAILEYIDTSEAETLYITSSMNVKPGHTYTHCEIHPSLILGIMGNQIIFPEHNQLPRDVFSCGQSKQAVSLYHSNFFNRIDKMGVILNYGQKPICRSRYLNYLNEEQHPYGENAIVAIMCHTSYNVEDSILINESAVKRGLFNTTYYNMYETFEETSASQTSNTNEKRIADVLKYNLQKTKPGYNYNELDEIGLIKLNTLVDDKTVLIGKISYPKNNPTTVMDDSIFPKKGQLGYVDKTYITENEEGRRIAKVRIREDRKPSVGDKFASRAGQKGTIGVLIPEENMPFTKDGLRPDLIINPHALPSRMTIGQLVESIFGKMACIKGCGVDSTAFLNKGPKDKIIGEVLNQFDYHSSGNELMYNGMTGEQIESAIFIGPTYYMRLKHMVKDKINYRARGPRTLMTRQTNHGRANDGGLRIGEMERDGVIAHGMSTFLYDSLMNRGDAYKVAICNHTGTLAIYNKETNHFYSPIVDGPIQYDILDKSTYIPNLITKYGKEFSIVEIPYSFKLLMQELTSMNVQMRLITADNIEQLTKQGDRTIYEKQLYTNLTSPKEEDLLQRIKRENEEQLRLKGNGNGNGNGNYGESELLTREEKKQLLSMNPQKIREFIEGHNVSDLTPLQQEIFVKIISESAYYMRLEQEVSQNELYKRILNDEINRMFEPTQSNINAQAELNRMNQNMREEQGQGSKFGNSRQNSPTGAGASAGIVVSKIGNDSNMTGTSEHPSITETTETTDATDTTKTTDATDATDATEPTETSKSNDSGTKVVKI